MSDDGTHDVVRTKLMAMQSYVEELRSYLDVDLASFEEDRRRQRAVERVCQVIIECAIDANALLINSSDKAPPASAREGFRSVHELGVIDDEVLRRFEVTYVGFRNRVVHDYEQLDNAIVFRTAQRLSQDAPRYMQCLISFLA